MQNVGSYAPVGGAADRRALQAAHQKNTQLCRRIFILLFTFFWLRPYSRSLLAIAVCDTPNRFTSLRVLGPNYDKAGSGQERFETTGNVIQRTFHRILTADCHRRGIVVRQQDILRTQLIPSSCVSARLTSI